MKEEGRGGDGARRMADGIPNKKQEPHLKTWDGIIGLKGTVV